MGRCYRGERNQHGNDRKEASKGDFVATRTTLESFTQKKEPGPKKKPVLQVEGGGETKKYWLIYTESHKVVGGRYCEEKRRTPRKFVDMPSKIWVGTSEKKGKRRGGEGGYQASVKKKFVPRGGKEKKKYWGRVAGGEQLRGGNGKRGKDCVLLD